MRRYFMLCVLALTMGAPAYAQKEEPLEGIALAQYARTWPALDGCVRQVAADRPAARRCLDELIHNGTAAAGAGNLKAQLLREQGDLDGAAAAIAQSIRLEANQDLHYLQSGQIILTRVRKASNPISQWRLASSADSVFEKAFAINPRGYPYRRHIVVSKLQAPALAGGDKTGALAMANEGIGMGLNDCYMLRGYAYIVMEKRADAFLDFDKASALGVYDNTLFVKAARTAVEAQDWARAEKYFRYVVEKKPESARSHYLLGEFYANRGDASRASALFTTALGIDPDYRAAAEQLARLRKGW